MHDYVGKKVLITTQNWFYAPDGKQYKAVYGTLKGVHEASKTLGFIPNRAHANWFIEIGEITIMGCQALYVLQCENINTGKVVSWHLDDKAIAAKEYEQPSSIYVTT